MFLLIQLLLMVVGAAATYYFFGKKLGFTPKSFAFLLVGLVVGTLVTRVSMLALPRILMTMIALAIGVSAVGLLWIGKDRLEGKTKYQIANDAMRILSERRKPS